MLTHKRVHGYLYRIEYWDNFNIVNRKVSANSCGFWLKYSHNMSPRKVLKLRSWEINNPPRAAKMYLPKTIYIHICCFNFDALTYARIERRYAVFLCWDQGSLLWRHNGPDSVSNHQPHDCLLNRLFRRRSKKISKLRVTGLCAWNSPGTGEFPAQMASSSTRKMFPFDDVIMLNLGGVSGSYSPPYWMPTHEPTALSRIKSKYLNSIARPSMIERAFSPLKTALP